MNKRRRDAWPHAPPLRPAQLSCSPEEMSVKSKSRVLAAFVALIVALAPCAVEAAKKSKKNKAIPKGAPVMWRPHRVESLDLFDGPGGRAGRPDLRRLRLIKSE